MMHRSQGLYQEVWILIDARSIPSFLTLLNRDILVSGSWEGDKGISRRRRLACVQIRVEEGSKWTLDL